MRGNENFRFAGSSSSSTLVTFSESQAHQAFFFNVSGDTRVHDVRTELRSVENLDNSGQNDTFDSHKLGCTSGITNPAFIHILHAEHCNPGRLFGIGVPRCALNVGGGGVAVRPEEHSYRYPPRLPVRYCAALLTVRKTGRPTLRTSNEFSPPTPKLLRLPKIVALLPMPSAAGKSYPAFAHRSSSTQTSEIPSGSQRAT